MLHWADSMFTWDKVGKTLFTCDFLGCHFCEPTMLDVNIHDKAAYGGEFAYYFAGIFGPFKPSVLAGLDKMPADADMVCTSHGPCLTETIAKAKELYRTWSTPAPKAKRTAFVVYASAYGCTRTLAETAAKALEGEGYDVTTADVTVVPYAECVKLAHEADVLLVGSPTINRAAPKAVWDVLTSIDPINLKGKAAGAFGAYGWSGEAAPMLHTFLKGLRYAAPEAPFRVLFTPTEADLEAMADYARSVAALCTVPVDAPEEKSAGGKFVCALCGYIYDPAEGDPAHGVAPGTPFDAIPPPGPAPCAAWTRACSSLWNKMSNKKSPGQRPGDFLWNSVNLHNGEAVGQLDAGPVIDGGAAGAGLLQDSLLVQHQDLPVPHEPFAVAHGGLDVGGVHGGDQSGDLVVHRHHGGAVGVDDDEVGLLAGLQGAVQLLVHQGTAPHLVPSAGCPERAPRWGPAASPCGSGR